MSERRAARISSVTGSGNYYANGCLRREARKARSAAAVISYYLGARSNDMSRGAMTNYFKLPTWADKDHVYAVVETPRSSRVKLEFDPKLGAFTLAKPLFAGLTYPYDWGFIPSTRAD